MSKDKAEEWTEEFLNSEEGLKAKEQFGKDFLNYVVFGESRVKVTQVINVDDCWVGHKIENVEEPVIEFLTATEIIKRFSEYLSEEQIEKLKNYEK